MLYCSSHQWKGTLRHIETDNVSIFPIQWMALIIKMDTSAIFDFAFYEKTIISKLYRGFTQYLVLITRGNKQSFLLNGK